MEENKNIKINANQFRIAVKEYYNELLINNSYSSKNFKAHLIKVYDGISNPLDINADYKPFNQPVCQYLDDCLEDASLLNKSICDTVSKIKHLLKWKINSNYKDVYPDDFFQNESFVEIIGPNGLLLCPEIRVGFLLLGQKVFYPSHKHEALELYNIMSGIGLWQIGNNEFVEKRPDDSIFHDLWIPHAMKTMGMPVLALFSWTGQIALEAVSISENQFYETS